VVVNLVVVEPDYEAARKTYDDAPIPIRKEDFVRRIVDAAIPGRIWAEEE
jgi:hypothetical protein